MRPQSFAEAAVDGESQEKQAIWAAAEPRRVHHAR